MDTPPNRSFPKRSLIVMVALLILAVLAMYVISMPRFVRGQQSLTDLQSIETLRTQFNQDAGKTRLILLVSPT